MSMHRLRYWYFFITTRIRFFLAAHTRFDVHSPFLSDFVAQVLEDRRWFYAFSAIETARKRWLCDETPVEASLFGAGSMGYAARQLKAGKLLQRSSVGPETGRRLFRLALWQQPTTMLELGTCMGISTAYLAAGRASAAFISIEGHWPLAEKARQHLHELGLNHVRVVNGAFADTLPEVLHQLQQVDLLFIDGDHRGSAVLGYLRTCLPFLHEQSVVVIADIHWSEDMWQAWQTMQVLPQVTGSADLFHLGVLFFRKALKHPVRATLAPWRWKPWRIGWW